MSFRRPLARVLGAVLLVACGGDNGTGPTPVQTPSAVTLAGGNAQQAPVGTALTAPLSVTVRDAKGAPVPSYPVSFVVTGGGGSVAAASVLTDASGVASTTWTLGTSTATAQTAEARVMSRDGGATVGTVAFTATAAPAAAASLTRVGADSLTGAAGAALADSVRVRLADQYGNPVRGVSVAFAVTAGGGAVAPATATTDSLGRAAAVWTLGPATGANTLTVTAPAATAVPALTLSATATATGTPGAAAAIVKVGGDNQSAAAGTALADSLVVKVTDAAGRGVSGVTVNWSSVNGGTLAPATATTRADGTARTRWTLPTGTGTRTAIAAVGGLGSVAFTATATTPPATNIEIVSPRDALSTPGRPLTHFVNGRILDAAGNPVANVTVVATVTAGGGQIARYGIVTGFDSNNPLVNSLTLTSDSAGRFGFGTWLAGPAEGTNAVTITAGGATLVLTTLATHRPFKAIDLGNRVACAIGVDDGIYCWGDNTSQQFGAPSEENSPYFNYGGARTPVKTRVPTSLQLTTISTSGHQCGLDAANVAYCWGFNSQAQTGHGYFGSVDFPPTPVSGGLTWSQVETGPAGTCGLTTAGKAYCWGLIVGGVDTSNTGIYFRCGVGNGVPCVKLPRQVLTSATFSEVAVSYKFACGVATDGTGYCWGLNDVGQLGRGAAAAAELPVATIAGGHRYSTISTGGLHGCGVATDDALTYCWGADSTGQLGDGATTTQPSPVAVATSQRFVKLAAGGRFTCGLTAAGDAFCWGANDRGQLGNGSTAASYVPVAVAGGFKFQKLTAGAWTVCGTVASGAIYCWGDPLETLYTAPGFVTTPKLLEFQP